MKGSLDEYLRRYPRLRALLVARSDGVASPRDAGSIVREHVRQRTKEAYRDPLGIGSAVTRRHALNGYRYRRALEELRGKPLAEGYRHLNGARSVTVYCPIIQFAHT